MYVVFQFLYKKIIGHSKLLPVLSKPLLTIFSFPFSNAIIRSYIIYKNLLNAVKGNNQKKKDLREDETN